MSDSLRVCSRARLCVNIILISSRDTNAFRTVNRFIIVVVVIITAICEELPVAIVISLDGKTSRERFVQVTRHGGNDCMYCMYD
jgi:hypothetical protein